MAPTAAAPPADTAFVVLSNPQLFRAIVAWASGWPALVARRWKEIKTARNVGKPSTHDFTWGLIVRLDVRALELTKRIHKNQFLVGVNTIDQAIKTGDGNVVRLALQYSTEPFARWRRRYWSLALDTFPGHTDVLEALHTFEPLDESNVWLTAFKERGTDDRYARERVFSTPDKWPLCVGAIRSVVLAEWLIEKFGSTRLPSVLISVAANRGNIALVEFLSGIETQKIERHTFLDAYRWSRELRTAGASYAGLYRLHEQRHASQLPANEHANYPAILDFLLRHRREPHTRKLEVACLEAGDAETLLLIQQTRGLRFLDDTNINQAAACGQLNLIQVLAANVRVTCTSAAMDDAAANGHLDVVMFLHNSDFATCSFRAMERAAQNGHLEVVQFLHSHRSEGCTHLAMDLAAASGFLNVVRFLHENRHEGCSTAAMDHAAQYGHLDVVQFLHENRQEGCTAKAFAYPYRAWTGSSWLSSTEATRQTLMFLLEHCTEMVHETFEHDAIRYEDVEALELVQRSRGLLAQDHVDVDILAGQGKLRFLRFLIEHVSVTCTTKAMDTAAAQGHLDVVRLLHETRSEGCTTAAMDSAAVARHWDVVAFLDAHRHEGCTYTLLRAAVQLGRLDLVQRYYRRFSPEELRTAALLARGYGFADVQRFLVTVASQPIRRKESPAITDLNRGSRDSSSDLREALGEAAYNVGTRPPGFGPLLGRACIPQHFGLLNSTRAGTKKTSTITNHEETLNDGSHREALLRAQRWDRIVMNDLETLPFAFAIFGSALLLECDEPLQVASMVVFTGSRFVFTYYYAKGAQPQRTIVYLVGAFAIASSVGGILSKIVALRA